MRPPNFGDTKIKQEITVNPLPWIIFHLETHKLHIIIDLYKTVYKISMISVKYNTIKSYNAKSAVREKKRWNRVLFYKTQ